MLFMLLAPTLLAAPVPKDKVAEWKKLDAHWHDLWSADSVARTKAVFALLDHPRAVEFLAEKLPPVDGSAEQLKTWLKDLNSVNEEVAAAAMAELWYHDPRTELTADEQLGLITTDHGRWRLASVWMGGPITLRPGTVRTSITPQRNGGRWFMLNEEQADGGGCGTGIGCPPAGEIATATWKRGGGFLPPPPPPHVLRRIDTKASRAALTRLASGHKDALPTRTAAGLLKAKAPAPLADKAFDTTWAGLLTNDPIAVTRGAFALLDTPDTAKTLKAELPAIRADKEQITKWVTALNDDDETVWKPACEKLLYFRPLLGLSWQGQCDAVTTDRGRSVVFHLAGEAVELPTADHIYPGCTVSARNDTGLTLSYVPGGGGMITTRREPGTLDTMTPPHWQRARLAVIILERAKADEAKAVLKQLADGHPDILPTKEAKAALERLKK
jgi:hypothetical protein